MVFVYMKQNKFFVLGFLISLFLFGCGGGGSGGTPNNVGSNGPSGGSSGGGPGTSPPTSSSNVAPLSVEYDGLRTPFVITNTNVGDIAVSALASLDQINQLVFGEQYSNSFTVLQASGTPVSSETLVCSSGTQTTETNAEQTLSTVTFNDCIIDGEEINGTLQSFIDTSDGLQRPTLNIDLSTFTIADNSRLSMRGHIVSIENESSQYQLLVADEEGAIWFDDLKAFIRPTGSRVYFLGDMYISDEGKLFVRTNDISFSDEEFAYVIDIDIIGDREVNANVVQGQSLVLSGPTLANNLSLDLVNFVGLPDTNLAPEARVSAEAKALYNEVISVDGTGSSDPNLQVISFKWEVIEQVDAAQVSIDTQNGTANISADRPGEYTIRMTATDPFGESDFVDVELVFEQRPPDGEIAFDAEQYTYSSEFVGSVAVSSPIFDGPFTFSLEYSPEGMVLDDDGNINWTVELPNLGQALEVRAGVRVTSPTHSEVFHASFEAVPERSVKRIPINTSLNFYSKFALDTTSPVYLNDRGAFNVEFSDESMILNPHPLPESMMRYATSLAHMADIDEDGDIDYFISLFNEETQTYQIFSIDAQGNRAFNYEFSSSDFPDLFIDLQIMDLSSEPLREVVLFDPYLSDFYRVLSNSGELLSSQGSLQEPWCDINGDGNIDWRIDAGYLLFNEAESIPEEYIGNYQAAEPRNRDVNGECVLFAVRSDDAGFPIDIVELRPFAEDASDIDTVIIKITDLANEFGIESNSPLSLTEFNADNDTENELMVTFFNGEQLIIDNVGANNQNVQMLNTNDNSRNQFSLTVSSTKISDINNDGVDEFFDLTGFNDGYSSIGVAFLGEESISQFVNTRTYDGFSRTIESWDGVQGIVGDNIDQLIDITIIDGKASQSELNDNINFGSLIVTEGTERFIYKFNEAIFELEKRTLDGSIVYQRQLSETVANTQIKEINEDFLLVSTLNPMIVEKSSGEVVYQFQALTTALAANNNQYLLPSSQPERVGFVIAFDEIENQLRIAALLQDGTFEDFSFTNLDELFSSPVERISLIQLDESSNKELVFIVTEFEGRRAFMVDLDSGALNELSQSIQRNVKAPDESLMLLSPCVINSQTCQNSIYGQAQGTSGFYGNVFAIDTVTGDTVWRTQQAFPRLRTLSIANNDGVYRTLVVTESDWFMLE